MLKKIRLTTKKDLRFCKIQEVKKGEKDFMVKLLGLRKKIHQQFWPEGFQPSWRLTTFLDPQKWCFGRTFFQLLPWNFSMEPKKWRWMEDDFPVQRDDFQVQNVSFRECMGILWYFHRQLTFFSTPLPVDRDFGLNEDGTMVRLGDSFCLSGSAVPTW